MTGRFALHVGLVVAALTPASPGSAQGRLAWTSAFGPAPRAAHAMVFDSVRGEVVLFGGAAGGLSTHQDTWTWNGASWQDRTPATGPGGTEYHAMAFDSARGLAWMFGGVTPATYNRDLWSWDGSAWTRHVSQLRPGPRTHCGLAYDPVRDRLVLFGGFGPNGVRSSTLGDTWEFDGQGWQRLQPSVSPPDRMSHAMVFDPATRRVLMVGGYRGTSVLGDCWSWDGRNWTQLAALPKPRRELRLAADTLRNQVVLFGGYDLSSSLNDTWLWDGSAWSQALPPGAVPPRRTYHAMAEGSTPGEVVLFGGTGNGYLGDTWTWDGVRWTQSATAPNVPILSAGRAVYDEARDEVLAVGVAQNGKLAQWSWDAAQWRQATTTLPPYRRDPALAYDPLRQTVVLFGGHDASRTLNLDDTWDWDGQQWSQRSIPAATPPARGRASMAFDRSAGRMLLFGGDQAIAFYYYTFTQYLGDLWTSTGQGWTQVSVAAGPSPRAGAAFAFDEARSEFVLFGGEDASGPLAETWTFDGASWTQHTPVPSPPAVRDRRMVYDAARQRLVLTGGETNLANPQDTWEWDGQRWTMLPLGIIPPGRPAALVAHDRLRGDTLLAGGWPDTWLLHPTDLTTSTATLPALLGGRVDFHIDASPALAGQSYLLVGCMDLGPRQGIALGATTLLLNPDAYFVATAAHPNTWIQSSLGTLDPQGRATASLNVPPGLLVGFAGLRLYHAYVVYGARFEWASTPVGLTVRP